MFKSEGGAPLRYRETLRVRPTELMISVRVVMPTTRLNGTTMAKKSNHQWTPGDDKRLLELHAAGKSPVMIAAALRRTTKSIPARLYILRTRRAKADELVESSDDVPGIDADLASPSALDLTRSHNAVDLIASRLVHCGCDSSGPLRSQAIAAEKTIPKP
jgi:hypothetical protein